MDYILLALLIFFVAKGFFKGFASMLFSIFGTALTFFVSLKLTNLCIPFVSQLVGSRLTVYISNLLDKIFPGTFSSINELENSLFKGEGGLFAELFQKLFKNISFSGTLTAGQIFANSISILAIKIITFAVIFISVLLIFKILRLFANKLVKFCGISTLNRVFGGIFGFLEGVLIFVIVFLILSAFANFTLNKSLLAFVNGGVFSKLLYENCVNFILNLFY